MRQVYKNLNEALRLGLGMSSKAVIFDEAATNADAVTSVISSAVFKFISDKTDHPAIKAAMSTSGDITKMEGYKDSVSAMSFLVNAATTTSFGGKPALKVKQSAALILNVAKILADDKSHYQAAFRKGKTESKSVQYIYAGVAAGIVYSASYIIAKCVDLQTMPDGTVRPVIIEERADEVLASLPISRLQRFYDAASKPSFKKVFNEAVEYDAECLAESYGFIGAIAASVTIIAALLFVARDIITWIFSTRQQLSGYLAMQGTMLKLNASRLGQGNVRKAQQGYADAFFKAADFVKVNTDSAEKAAIQTTELENRQIEAVVSNTRTANSVSSGGSLI